VAVPDGRPNIGCVALGNSFTLADLEAMPDDGRRYELIGGAILMTAAPGPRHQLVSARLRRLLEDTLPEGHAVFAAPIDLDLPGEQRVQPDLVVLPWSSVGEKRLTVPVFLLVEIISPGSRTLDTVTKRAVYAAAGISAYWILDPATDELTALRLDNDGSYRPYAQGHTVSVDWPLPLHLEVAALGQRPA
jgi:Uma2 family endonuclease